MKLGVSAFAWTTEFRPTDFHLLDFAKAQGYDGFEIPIFEPGKIAAKELRCGFDAAGLECTVCAILPEDVNPISEDALVRKRSVEHLKKILDVSAELGATRVGGPLYAPIGYTQGRRRNADEWQWAVDSFREIAPDVESRGIKLSIEPVSRAESFFLNTAAETVEFCEAVGSESIGILIDTFHANIEEKKVDAAVKTAGRRLMHVHMSENDRSLVGSGHIDFPAVVKTLKAMGYDGYLMVEGFGYSDAPENKLGARWAEKHVSPEMIATDGIKYLRGLL
jgi:D-psicose/D-tagatose/L-ribulose 3-epimerase